MSWLLLLTARTRAGLVLRGRVETDSRPAKKRYCCARDVPDLQRREPCRHEILPRVRDAAGQQCQSCGAARVGEAKFCGECGTPFASADQAPSAATPGTGAGPAPVAERRLVSILFADLVGFTPFAEERDSEDVRETLTRYFDLAAEVITGYGGTVEKFIGDAVMAVWGAPIAQEDDAERSRAGRARAGRRGSRPWARESRPAPAC